MNGSTGSPATTSAPASPRREEVTAQIDASCGVLMLPIFASLKWLFLSSIFLLIASVKIHSPAVLANVAWLGYGRLRPAALDMFLYGFASQAGLAIAVWMLCRLGRTTLAGKGPLVIGTIFWNLAVLIGVIGVLAGHTTGFQWIDFPSAASGLLIASYAVLGVCALLTFKARTERELYPSQWYLLAALFWFPWLYTTARLLLVWFPVRGVLQVAVNGWFMNGLFTLWLGGMAAAILLYFIPKLSGTPLHSRTLAILGFWTLAVFGGFAGFYRGQPLPNWLISASTSGTVLLLVATFAVVANLWLTLQDSRNGAAPLMRFFKASGVFLLLGSICAVLAATVPQLRLTLFGEGMEHVGLYGFVGLALFGAIHFIAPRISGSVNDKFISLSYWGLLIGLLLFAGVYLAGGIVQQMRLANGAVPFVEVMNGMKPFIRISTLGILLLIAANGAILFRVGLMMRDWCRTCCACCCPGESATKGKFKPAGASR